MAKGNQNGNVQGDWQRQGRPSGMLGPNAQASGAPQPMQQQQSQSGGYAYPWMQAGKWGDIGGSGLSGLSGLLNQFGQQQSATGTPTAPSAPSAPTSPTTPTNAIATDADPYAAATAAGYAPQSPSQQFTGPMTGNAYNNASNNPNWDPRVGGKTRPADEGPWTYDGTPFTYDDGFSKGLWTVPGTLDANGYPTLPDRSTWPEPQVGTWGDPLPAELQYLSPRNNGSILTQQQIDAKISSKPSSIAQLRALTAGMNEADTTAAYNDYYGGNAIENLQNRTSTMGNPMGATVVQERINLLKSQGLLPADWGT